MNLLRNLAISGGLLLPLAAGCGGTKPIPARGVVETDIGKWHFRRFQPVLDVEVWVDNNQATAFTASYVRDEAEKRGTIRDEEIANAFVTRYQEPRGILRATVQFARQLGSAGGYQVDEATVEGVRLFQIVGNEETWALWAAKSHVVKIGGRARTSIPNELIAAYGKRYPSVLRGGLLEGPLPDAEPMNAPGQGSGSGSGDGTNEPYDPNSPKPDWDKYK